MGSVPPLIDMEEEVHVCLFSLGVSLEERGILLMLG